MNLKSVGPFKIKLESRKKDLQILGDLVNCIEFFTEKLGWNQELDSLIEEERLILVIIFIINNFLNIII